MSVPTFLFPTKHFSRVSWRASGGKSGTRKTSTPSTSGTVSAIGTAGERGSNFHGLRVHAIPVHPFADRFVMDAYLSLPEKSLAGQPVHCLAAMRGAPEFGDVPTGDNPFSLRVELAARHLMMPGKQLLGGWRRLRASAPRRVVMEPPGPRHVRLLQAARESGLFVDNLPRLPAWQDPRNRGAAAKLGSTAIHFAGATGLDLPAAPKPLFLRGLAAAAPGSGIVRQG